MATFLRAHPTLRTAHHGRSGRSAAPSVCPHPCSTSSHTRLSGLTTAWSQPEDKSNAPAQQVEEDLPPWVRSEKQRELQAQSGGGFKLPWGMALLCSVLVAIAATGSIFEYVDRNPIFGIVQPDNPLWAPILLGFAITGYPVCGLLFKYGVDEFNAEAELQDKIDGYLPRDRK